MSGSTKKPFRHVAEVVRVRFEVSRLRLRNFEDDLQGGKFYSRHIEIGNMLSLTVLADLTPAHPQCRIGENIVGLIADGGLEFSDEQSRRRLSDRGHW